MLVGLVKLVYFFSYGAYVFSLLMHFLCLLCNVKADGTSNAMLVKISIIIPEAMRCMLMPLKLAAAVARHLLEQRFAFCCFCPFVHHPHLTSHVRRYLLRCAPGRNEEI